MTGKRKASGDGISRKVQKVTTVSRTEGAMENLEQKTAKLERELRRLKTTRERKYYEYAVTTPATFGTTSIVYNICQPGQGINQVERIGDVVQPSFLHFRGVVDSAPGSTVASIARITVIQRKDGLIPTGDTTALTRVYGTGIGTAAAPVTQYHWDNRDDFIVLHDETVRLSPLGQDDSQHVIEISRRLKNKVYFQNGATTVERGGIYLLLTSSLGATSPRAFFTSRVTYFDD